MHRVDLNCDMGESFGAYTMGQDEDVLKFISSANIACGFHAGDPSVIVKTVEMAIQNEVSIGAHPGYPDLVGFGRRALQASPKEVYDMVLYQVSALQGITNAYGGSLQHIKPHGALYNTAAKDSKIAEAIAQAIYKVAPDSILFGLANSELIKAGQRVGLKTAQEVFADRTYQDNGQLTPRTEAQAIIHNREEAIQQVLQMILQGHVTSASDKIIPIQADTICIHGDHPSALSFASELHQALVDNHVQVEAIGKWKA